MREDSVPSFALHLLHYLLELLELNTTASYATTSPLTGIDLICFAYCRIQAAGTFRLTPQLSHLVLLLMPPVPHAINSDEPGATQQSFTKAVGPPKRPRTKDPAPVLWWDNETVYSQLPCKKRKPCLEGHRSILSSGLSKASGTCVGEFTILKHLKLKPGLAFPFLEKSKATGHELDKKNGRFVNVSPNPAFSAVKVKARL
ncbi:hypothetical protein HDK90DRAFT_465551 [Phyllosticta capitalensis]|uniref:Uncharacterized protein n=1 Tax=Phyllosticta capitalensis TaxID=121624 RepID=A0ABR1YP16_9PEZI